MQNANNTNNLNLDELKQQFKVKKENAKQKQNILNSNLLNKIGIGKIPNFAVKSLWQQILSVLTQMFHYFLDNIPELAIKIVVVAIIIVVYAVIGGCFLYLCKTSHANMLPTDINCSPYTENTPENKNTIINVFISTIENQEKSMNLKFNWDNNGDNTVLNFIRNYTNTSGSYLIIIYLFSIVSQLHQYFYSIIDFVGKKMSALPDLLVVGLAPIAFLMAIMFMYFTGNIYFMLQWFYQMKWFFKKDDNCKKTGKAIWQDINMFTNPVSFYTAVMLTGLASFASFFVGMGLLYNTLFSIPSLSIIYCLFNAFTIRSEIRDENVGVMDIVWYVFVHFRPAIFLTICFFTVYRSSLMNYVFQFYEKYNEYNMKNSQKGNSMAGYFSNNNNNNNKKVDKLDKKVNNMNTKVLDMLQDAYTVSIPYTIVMLSVLCILLTRFGLLQPVDFSLFDNVVDDTKIEPPICVPANQPANADGDGEHSFLYTGYMMLKAGLNFYKQLYSKMGKSSKSKVAKPVNVVKPTETVKLPEQNIVKPTETVKLPEQNIVKPIDSIKTSETVKPADIKKIV